MNCPVCTKPLKSQPGTQLDPRDGVTVYCPHRNCPAQEISGHGSTEAAAYKIITQRRLNYDANND